MQPATVQQAFELALQHHHVGRLAEAEALYRQILAVQPNHIEALHHLGIIALQIGRYDLAVEWIGQSLVLNPNNPDAHSNLGEVYRLTGSLDEAIAAFRRALQLKPDLLEAHNNLGNVLRDRHQLDEAISAYRCALELNPGYPDACNNLGVALTEQGQLDEAISAYRSALELKPNYPEAYTNLGNALKIRGQLDEAISAYRCALELNPSYADAHNNLGVALTERGQLDEAISAYHSALRFRPDLADAHNNLGNAFKEQGQLDEAIAAYRRALRFKPEDARFSSNAIYALHFHPETDAGAIAEEHQRWNGQFSKPLKRSVLAHSNDRSPERRLRIGYVSPDFREHVVGWNLLPLFQHHDRRDFEVLCCSGVMRPDKLTAKVRLRADKWCNTAGMADEALAEMIRQDGMDILVDLSQHMAGNRLTVFARNPAPVQVSFAGYPESTGLDAIKYRISDRYLEADFPESHEKGRDRVFLLDSFWCYDPCGLEAEVNELPIQKSGAITFGSLNNFCKVNEPLLKLWARVLKAVKNSRLIILSHQGSHRQRTVQFLDAENIEPHRVKFVTPRSRKEYLELYHRLDIALDTFPYNGHTTSLDALWMGVPVVSLCGERPVSRAGLSQLSNLGLPELVAFTENQYVEIATQLANGIPRLQELRATLRQRMEKSVLMDAPHFARQIEACYRSMWRQWCESQNS